MARISLQEYGEQIERTIEEGRYVQAVAHGKHILEQFPKHVATYRMLGKAMLEADRDNFATDMFRRVLSADPEDLVSWVGLSEIANRQGQLDAAIWYLERAFELAPENLAVAEELRGLYGRRDGVEPARVQLTRGALARLYLRGDLLSRAIREFQALLEEQPERADLSVALAEALWRNEQRLESVEVCQQVLDVLPYCLKANLILGEIWTTSGRDEGKMYLQRARALDPENRTAEALFGALSPFPAAEAQIEPLAYQPIAEEERPAWMEELAAVSVEEPSPVEREAALVDVAAAIEAQIEIPPWLEEVAEEEAPAPVHEPALAEPAREAEPVQEEVPEWLAGIRAESREEELKPADVGTDFVPAIEKPQPDVGAGLAPAPEPAESEERVPDWLAGIREEIAEEAIESAAEEALPEVEPAGLPTAAAGLAAAAALAAESRLKEEREAEEVEQVEEPPIEPEAALAAEERIPEWPAEPEAEVAVEEAAPPAGPEELPEDWLAGIREQLIEEAKLSEEALPEAEIAPEEAPMPDWLEGEGVPSGDEALAWLESLAEGKEEELRAQAEVEAEARLAEILGRSKPEAPAPVEAAPAEAEAAPPEIEEVMPPSLEEAVTPAAAEAFGWTAFGEVSEPPEAPEVPEKEAAPELEPEVEAALEPEPEAPMPDWLEGEGVPSGDEALAWLESLAEGKEEELRAQAEAEAEARMAEIMGRSKPEAPAPAEAPAVEAEIKEVEEVALPRLEELAPAPAEAPVPEPEAPPEAAAVEEVAPPETLEPPYVEAPPVIEAPAREEVLPFDEAPVPEAEAEIEEIKVEEEEITLPPIVEEEVPQPAEVVQLAVAPEAPAVEPAIESLEAQRAYLKEHRRDYEAWLTLARALWQVGEKEEALEAYGRVVRGGKLLESVIPELEQRLEESPTARVQRALGDAYMKDGRLDEALTIYRRALEGL
jgi:tetratricopeptide (TPR) repeat protein